VQDWPEYEVSDDGQVRRNGRILSQGTTRNGYKRVNVSVQGIGKTLSVHRLVAHAFAENPGGLNEVNHIDGDKTNNVASNLEWSTRSGNLLHAYATGLKSPRRGPAVWSSVLNELQTRVVIRCIQIGLPSAYIARAFSVSGNTVRDIKLGTTWRHLTGGAVEVMQ
jgi:hypothetical protein